MTILISQRFQRTERRSGVKLRRYNKKGGNDPLSHFLLTVNHAISICRGPLSFACSFFGIVRLRIPSLCEADIFS